MTRNFYSSSFIALLAISLTQSFASASGPLVQVPNLSGFGNSNNVAPFFTGFAPMRYQQIYAASAFPQGGTIDKFMFRSDEQFGSKYGPTSIDLQVAFAYAATTVNNPSTVFANNIGTDFTVVLDGVITRSNNGPLPTSSFDFVFDVANTFNYDPTKGDLLVQILARNRGLQFTSFDASLSPQQNVTARIVSDGTTSGLTATTGMLNNIDPLQPYGLVTQFEFVSVPEPSCLALAIFGAMIFGVSRSRSRYSAK